MSLNIIERRNTIQEFKKNIKLIGLTTQLIARELEISEQQLIKIINLKCSRFEDPWIVRNYILDYAQEKGVELIPFSKLQGDYHDYFFLDSEYIKKGIIS